jgi:plastocyanin
VLRLNGVDSANFVWQATASGTVEIDVVAYHRLPAFSPTLIHASPGQTIEVTVAQSGDLSSEFRHNFSIDSLGIDEDLPRGDGHSITMTVTVPRSGRLVFFCKYHVQAEQHAGAFLVP